MTPSLARSWQEQLIGVFLPDFCALCERLGEVLCPECRQLLRPAQPDPSHLALYVFDSPVKGLIHRLKYDGEFWLLRVFAAEARLRLAGIEVDALVPVPLHLRRLKERGFNQANLLARSWAKLLGVPVARDALRRVVDTPSQTGLDKRSRLENLAGAFVATGAAQVLRKTILLVDDVRTTGATLDTAARELRRAGAKKVLTATVAVVP